jgi:hypothetical protein
MQTDRSVDPVGWPNNSQEDNSSSAPLASLSHTSHTFESIAGSSVWIDPVVQRNISATSFSYEKKHGAFPPTSFASSPASPMLPAIPRRASAHPASVVKVRPRYTRSIFVPEDSDVTRIPTLSQPTMWQYETPEYQAESSLSSLSLVVADVPTTPPPQQTKDEIDKRDPFPSSIQHNRGASLNTPLPFDELDTVQSGAMTVAASAVPKARVASGDERPLIAVEEGTLASWTAGRGAHSPLARRIASRQRAPMSRATSSFWASVFTPLDHLRWWLLIPGRLEFLLWFGGTILLMSITCIFLFACLVSAGWLGGTIASSTFPGTRQTTVTTRCTTTTGDKPCVTSTHTSSASTALVLNAAFTSPLEAGMSVRLQGRGFSANGPVSLTHDGGFSCQPGTVNADGHGAFQVEVVVGVDALWGPGPHVLKAYDVVSKRSVTTTIMLAPSPIGRSATPTAVPVSTATPSDNGGFGPQPTPVGLGQTPTPTVATPTVGITPTPTESAPTPTPSPGLTPTTSPSPTPAAPTPTASPKLTATTMTSPQDIVTTSQTMALTGVAASATGPQSSGLWLWLMGIGYGLSLALLAIAGLLYRRRRSY